MLGGPADAFNASVSAGGSSEVPQPPSQASHSAAAQRSFPPPPPAAAAAAAHPEGSHLEYPETKGAVAPPPPPEVAPPPMTASGPGAEAAVYEYYNYPTTMVHRQSAPHPMEYAHSGPSAHVPYMYDPMAPIPYPTKAKGRNKHGGTQGPGQPGQVLHAAGGIPIGHNAITPEAAMIENTPPLPGDSEEAAVRCPFPGCNKSFAKNRTYNLKAHLRSHSQVKPFQCLSCQRAFSRKHDLERHSRTHTGDKPYICDACGRGFPRSDALRRHWRVERVCGEKAAAMEAPGSEGLEAELAADYAAEMAAAGVSQDAAVLNSAAATAAAAAAMAQGDPASIEAVTDPALEAATGSITAAEDPAKRQRVQ